MYMIKKKFNFRELFKKRQFDKLRNNLYLYKLKNVMLF